MIKPNFNTLSATQKLRDSGIDGAQAESVVSIVVESQTDLATKEDLARLDASTKVAIADLKASTQLDMANLRHSIIMHMYALMGGTVAGTGAIVLFALRHFNGA